MGGMSFGNLPGNNAPTPVFGGTNPTGMLPGGYGGEKNTFGFPSHNMFGAPSPADANYVTPMANQGIFPMSSGGIGGLSTGFGGVGGDPNTQAQMLRQLQNDYGAGMGSMLAQILSGGLFNPQVANAYINAMQPAYNRGMAAIGSEFGAEGARFGSSAALGFGDYSSQFALNEQQTMAQMYLQSQQEQLSLLENILPTVHAEQASSQSSGWVGDLLGGLEIAAGAIGAPFTGGATIPLIGAGVGTIASSNQGGGGGGGASLPPINISLPKSTPPFIDPSQTQQQVGQWPQEWQLPALDASAAGSLGGADTYSPGYIPGADTSSLFGIDALQA